MIRSSLAPLISILLCAIPSCREDPSSPFDSAVGGDQAQRDGPGGDLSAGDDASIDMSAGDVSGGADGGSSSIWPPSVYEVPIALPSCSGPKARLIKKAAAWADINDGAYTVFCVTPGDYTAAGDITLTADGAAGAKRWIRWYNPAAPADTTTHPVKMTPAKQAVIRRLVLGSAGNPAKHWIIDRLTLRGFNGTNLVGEKSSDNVLNRLLVEKGGGHLVTFKSASGNVLQNSVVRETERHPDKDQTCINLASGQQDTRIVNNEIYNCAGDGIQFSPGSGYAIVENNDIYITNALYSDCAGKLDKTGDCACAENAIDFKSPGGRKAPLPEAQWVRIERNRMWGFRPTDQKCGGTGSPGSIVTIGTQPTDFVLVRQNVVMDGPMGVAIGKNTVHHVSVIGNLLYKISGALAGTAPSIALANIKHDRVEFYNNTVVDSDHWFRNGPTADNNDVRCNVAINCKGRPYNVAWGAGSQADYNFFYNTKQYTTESPSHDIVDGSAAASKHVEHRFHRRRWTGPEEIGVPLGRPTAASPHVGKCDPKLGARKDIGVNDAIGSFLGTWPGL